MAGHRILNWSWTKQREKAAWLKAEGDLSEYEIATQCGVSRETIQVWARSPEFQARIDEHVAEILKALRSTGIGNVANRIKRLDRDWKKLQKIVEARAAAADPDIPGMDTGHITHTEKMIGQGPMAQVIDEYRVDVATLKELRDIEKQAAQELGQWTEKQDLTSGGAKLETVIILPPNGR